MHRQRNVFPKGVGNAQCITLPTCRGYQLICCFQREGMGVTRDDFASDVIHMTRCVSEGCSARQEGRRERTSSILLKDTVHQLIARMYVGFLIDCAQVGIHGTDAHAQRASNLRISPSSCDQVKHFELAFGQIVRSTSLFGNRIGNPNMIEANRLPLHDERLFWHHCSSFRPRSSECLFSPLDARESYQVFVVGPLALKWTRMRQSIGDIQCLCTSP